MNLFTLLSFLGVIAQCVYSFVPSINIHTATQRLQQRPTATCSSSTFVLRQGGGTMLAKAGGRALLRQRDGMKMGLFGLGAPEIGVILVVLAVVLGPEKLSEFAKDAGKMAGELKEVPKEFQAGIDEGEASMKSMKVAEREPTKVEAAEKTD